MPPNLSLRVLLDLASPRKDRPVGVLDAFPVPSSGREHSRVQKARNPTCNAASTAPKAAEAPPVHPGARLGSF